MSHPSRPQVEYRTLPRFSSSTTTATDGNVIPINHTSTRHEQSSLHRQSNHSQSSSGTQPPTESGYQQSLDSYQHAPRYNADKHADKPTAQCSSQSFAQFDAYSNIEQYRPIENSLVFETSIDIPLARQPSSTSEPPVAEQLLYRSHDQSSQLPQRMRTTSGLDSSTDSYAPGQPHLFAVRALPDPGSQKASTSLSTTKSQRKPSGGGGRRLPAIPILQQRPSNVVVGSSASEYSPTMFPTAAEEKRAIFAGVQDGASFSRAISPAYVATPPPPPPPPPPPLPPPPALSQASVQPLSASNSLLHNTSPQYHPLFVVPSSSFTTPVSNTGVSLGPNFASVSNPQCHPPATYETTPTSRYSISRSRTGHEPSSSDVSISSYYSTQPTQSSTEYSQIDYSSPSRSSSFFLNGQGGLSRPSHVSESSSESISRPGSHRHDITRGSSMLSPLTDVSVHSSQPFRTDRMLDRTTSSLSMGSFLPIAETLPSPEITSINQPSYQNSERAPYRSSPITDEILKETTTTFRRFPSLAYHSANPRPSRYGQYPQPLFSDEDQERDHQATLDRATFRHKEGFDRERKFRAKSVLQTDAQPEELVDTLIEPGDEGDLDLYLRGGVSDVEEDSELRFFQVALLSNVAVHLKDKVVRGEHIKGSISFHNSFTGKNIVTAIQSFMPSFIRQSENDRRAALEVARALKSQLFIIEVDFDDIPLTDSLDDVFTFMDESEIGAGGVAELPTGVFTYLTKCYSASCPGDQSCYSYTCPHKTQSNSLSRNLSTVSTTGETRQRKRTWAETVDPFVLRNLSESEIRKQEAIHTMVLQEEQYKEDLLTIETLFIIPLRSADPPIIHPQPVLESFIHTVFSNLLEIRLANERLIELFTVRQREQRPTIETIGDVFLHAAAEFRPIYAEYLSKVPAAELCLDATMEKFPEFRMLVERASHTPEARGRDLKKFLSRPLTQLQRYHKLLDAILKETDPNHFDAEFIAEADGAISKFAMEGKLLGFQAGNGRGVHDHLEWHDFVSDEDLQSLPKQIQARQHVIFEIIKGEIQYVSDLTALEPLFIVPLREAVPPIINAARINRFILDVFHNYQDILSIHRHLLNRLKKRQRDQHPKIVSVTDLIYDSLLQWEDSYRAYAANYPIAKFMIDKERKNNPAFSNFFDNCTRQKLAYKKDMYDFINRPIPRLLRYDLLLKEILKLTGKEGLPTDEVKQVLEELQASASLVDKAVEEAQLKIEMWQLKDTLAIPSDAKIHDSVIAELELMHPNRQLIHKGYLRQPDGLQVFIILLDNYLVTTRIMKVREGKKDEGQQKHVLQKRPIPLSLLDLGNFSGAMSRASSLSTGLIGRGKDRSEVINSSEAESKQVFPFTYVVGSSGVMGGTYQLWADSEQSRSEWKNKLQEAKTLSDVVSDSNKAFELGELCVSTLFKSGSAPPQSSLGRPTHPSPYAGQVNCSVPFRTRDGRELVAIGCDEGVWIGMRGNLRSFSKVLHVKNVTVIAVLESFGMFLVLADHSLFAYQLEALVPSPSGPAASSRGPERLSGTAHVLSFSVGQLSGRTLVAYMKKKQLDSVFRVLEPISKGARGDTGRRGFFGSNKGTSFEVYKDFFIPTDAKFIHFLKAKLAIVCAKGFEIMDLQSLQTGSIPVFHAQKMKDNATMQALSKRCENASALGMFKSTDTEFILCYNTFGLYVEKHGEPARGGKTIDWETLPKTVAFHPPYFLLFSWNYIEIRHIQTGRLAQIITGKDVRCVWDGSGVNSLSQATPGPQGYGVESATMESKVHIVMDGEKNQANDTPQTIFELQPTVLLDNPLSGSEGPAVLSHHQDHRPLMNQHSSQFLPPQIVFNQPVRNQFSSQTPVPQQQSPYPHSYR